MKRIRSQEVVVKTRHDAWTLDNDKLLAETVLAYVQNGCTQTAAFEDVGNQLNRTAAACGYRWNAEIRKKYVKEFEDAKKRRKELARKKERDYVKEEPQVSQCINQSSSLANKEKNDVQDLTIKDCIRYLSQINDKEDHLQILDENKRLQEENTKLKNMKQDLTKRYDQLFHQKQKIDHNYKILISLISQAKQMSENHLEEKQNYH